jgi:hypothetical protein
VINQTKLHKEISEKQVACFVVVFYLFFQYNFFHTYTVITHTNATMADANKELLTLFLESGLDQRKAEDTLKNAHLKETLATILKEAKAHPTNPVVKDFSNHLYLTATTFPNEVLSNKELRNLVINYIVEKKINKVNFDAVKNFFKKLGQTPFNLEKFETDCGIGLRCL